MNKKRHKNQFYSFCFFIFFLLLINSIPCHQVIASQQTSNTNTPHLPPYQRACTKKFDLLHTKLEIKFNWDQKQLQSIATLHLKPHCYPQSELVLDASQLIIHQIVLLIPEEAEKAVAYQYNGTQLVIDLGHNYTQDDTLTIMITYETQPNPVNNFEFGSKQGLFFIDDDHKSCLRPIQIWTQGEPNTNSSWFPTIDAPNQRSTQEMYITVPDQYKTLSNGLLIYTTLNEDQTRTDYWRMDLPHAPYLFMLAVGKFDEIQEEWNDVPISYYIPHNYAPYAHDIFKHTIEMLDFFSEKLDYPYPWPKYSQIIVRDYLTGAMENTTAVILSERLQATTSELVDCKDQDEVISHELFHHWFGNLVTCESWGQLALNESMATLGSHLWFEHKFGTFESGRLIRNSMLAYQQAVLAHEEQKPIIRNRYHTPIEMFDSYTYHKGALVLHMLKNYLGTEVFWHSLNQYLKRHAFTATDIHQFRKCFEEIVGEDLNWFFNQWFLQAGEPSLHIEHSYVQNELILKIKQLTQGAKVNEIYELPLAVDIWVKGQKTRHFLRCDQSQQVFIFPVSSQPDLVYLDRNYFLVGELIHPMGKAENYQNLFQYYNKEGNFLACSIAINYFETLPDKNKALKFAFFKTLLNKDIYWEFKVKALNAFKYFPSKNKLFPSIEKKVIKLTKDSNSYVRSAALEVLLTFKQKDSYIPIYEALLKDPACRVITKALYAYALYANVEQDIKKNILENFEAEETLSIIRTLANYYIETKYQDKYNWLRAKTEKLYNQLNFELLLVDLAQYTSKVDKRHVQGTHSFLRDIAMNHAKAHVQKAAQTGLEILASHKIDL